MSDSLFFSYFASTDKEHDSTAESFPQTAHFKLLFVSKGEELVWKCNESFYWISWFNQPLQLTSHNLLKIKVFWSGRMEPQYCWMHTGNEWMNEGRKEWMNEWIRNILDFFRCWQEYSAASLCSPAIIKRYNKTRNFPEYTFLYFEVVKYQLIT